MEKKGQIRVDSQNIMPVIKKWLYSDKDIFLRELVSNACDAVAKYKKLVTLGNAPDDAAGYRVNVYTDKDNGLLKVEDNGLGMTAEEVEKYIAQVAFSGAEDFVAKYTDAGKDGIIGHFGLGFYSAYMVSDLVEIDSLSYQEGAESVNWASDGGSEYTIKEGTRNSRGTTVTLHVSDTEKEFLQEYRIRELLRKYCAFMPVEIYLNPKGTEEDKPVNDISPLWLRDPKTVTKEEYEKFYQDTFLDFTKPLFWIHLNMDYPFRLKGILYFPRQKNPLEVVQGQVKLYCNQVFIADNIKEVIPEFLMLLKGCIDCPDIPLNVSRSFLQNDREVQKIAKHITKKVADKLNEQFAEDRKQFTEYYPDLAPFVKFGCIKDETFYDKVKDSLLFESIDGSFKTLKEILPQAEEEPEKSAEGASAEGDGKSETAKEEKPKEPVKLYYVTDKNAQAQYIERFKENGLDAFVLTHYIDTHFISFLEYKEGNLRFLRIDSETPDSLKSDDALDNAEQIKELFRQNLDKKDVKVELQGYKDATVPAYMIINEMTRRYSEMSSMYGGAMPMQEEITVVLNAANPVVKKLASLEGDALKEACAYIYDLALMANRPLPAEELNRFLKLSAEMLEKTV